VENLAFIVPDIGVKVSKINALFVGKQTLVIFCSFLPGNALFCEGFRLFYVLL
jgi:hypothetical protein